MSAKTDNSNLESKLELRRYFLQKYPPISVLDCCQGSCILWNVLRKEFAPRVYFPVDVKPKKGRIKMDSARILAASGWSYDCIDVDTYGEPWVHWKHIVEYGRGAISVFLTYGTVMIRGGRVSDDLAAWCGMGPLLGIVPRSLQASCADIAAPYALNRAVLAGFSVLEALEAPASKNARYFGIRMVRN